MSTCSAIPASFDSPFSHFWGMLISERDEFPADFAGALVGAPSFDSQEGL